MAKRNRESKRIKFTKAAVTAIPFPDAGRDIWRDTEQDHLALFVTPGSKRFYWSGWATGRPVQLFIAKYPDMSVDDARKEARALSVRRDKGEDVSAERKARREEPTLGELHKSWMLFARGHKKPRSADEDARIFKTLIPTCLAGRRLSAIHKSDIQALHTKIGDGSGIYAANRTLALLRAMFNRADDVGFQGDNPCKGVKPFREQSRDRFLQPDELAAFFTALADEEEVYRDYFTMALLTGARKTNLMEMRWTDVDLSSGYWRIPETKNGQVVVVPLVGAAVALLTRRQAERKDDEWVFPDPRLSGHVRKVDRPWNRIIKAAKLEDVRIHDLRRSVGSWLASENVSLIVIGKILGHRTPQATSVYSRLRLDPAREALERATTAMLSAGKKTDLLTPKQE